jgi:putative DNA primase/helicase
MSDYAKSLSPASIAKKSASSDKPKPEFARLAGMHFVNIGEPDKGLSLNVALMKRLTGGEPIIARELHKNPVEYVPQFKLFINSNHRLAIDDDTIFSSDRIKMIPFDRHFDETERDATLKAEFKKSENVSGIFNWLLEGYKLFINEGLTMPARAEAALIEYRRECDTIALFMENELTKCTDKKWIKTNDLYERYRPWCIDNNIEEKSQKEFVAIIRNKNLLDRDRKDGHIVKGYKFKEQQ